MTSVQERACPLLAVCLALSSVTLYVGRCIVPVSRAKRRLRENSVFVFKEGLNGGEGTL